MSFANEIYIMVGYSIFVQKSTSHYVFGKCKYIQKVIDMIFNFYEISSMPISQNLNHVCGTFKEIQQF
jgi:hypothetical protein